MYVKLIHSLTTDTLAEGATDHPPDLFDYVTIGGKDYQVVERIISIAEVKQGPFGERTLTTLTTIFVEDRANGQTTSQE
jgi:hypothetical protein